MWTLLVFVCAVNGFGSCVETGVAAVKIDGFTNQFACVKEANEVVNRLNRRRGPMFYDSHCVEIR